MLKAAATTVELRINKGKTKIMKVKTDSYVGKWFR